MKIKVLLCLSFYCIYCAAKTIVVDKHFVPGIYGNIDTVVVNCNIDTLKKQVIKSFPNVECYLCDNAPYKSNNGILYNKSGDCIYLVPSNYHFNDNKYKCCSRIQSISTGAFFNCKNLHEVDLNDVKSIGAGSFNSCENLVEIKFGRKICTIDNGAFGNCKRLKSVHIQRVDSVKNGAFYKCEGLEDLYIHSSDYIGALCFYECINLYKIALPGCMYEYLVFSEKMPHLQCLYMGGLPSYHKSMERHIYLFSCVPSNAVLFVKKEYIEDFKKLTAFSQFAKIKEYKDISLKKFERINVEKALELKCFEED